MPEKIKAHILDSEGINKVISRIAHEIVERYESTENLVLVGIRKRGEFIANRLVENLEKITGQKISIGYLDVTFYRDDFRERLIQPQVKGTEIPFSIDGKIIILTDDVLYTGRTIRAAMNEIMDFGRPSAISLAVLIDRGHREMPVKADFVGKNVPTSENEHVHVRLEETDDEDAVYLVEYS
tara:strand:+ start:2657 stop:3202 length:546 start_codon:yes stop_codon:yes gene_type:complete